MTDGQKASVFLLEGMMNYEKIWCLCHKCFHFCESPYKDTGLKVAWHRASWSALCKVSLKKKSVCPHSRCPLLLSAVKVTEQYMNRPNDSWTMLTCTLVYFWIDFLVKEVLSQQVKLSIFFPDAVSAHKLKLFQRKLIELVLHLPYVGLLQLWDGLFSGRFLLARFPQVRLLTCNWSQRHNEMQVTQEV